jgi:hypothetical protein
VTKTILIPGDNYAGKPGKPYIVKVNLLGYFAPDKPKSKLESKEDINEEKQKEDGTNPN